MTQNILKIFGIAVIAILQLTLLPHLGFNSAWPNLILIVALSLMILDLEIESFLVASVGGLVLDLAGPLFFGIHSVILLAFVLITKLLLKKFLTEPNIIVTGLLLGLASLLNDLIIILIAKNFIWIPILANGFYSAITGVLLYRFFEHWFKKQPLIKMVIQ